MSIFKNAMACLYLLSAATVVQAATITLVPSSVSIVPGEQVVLDLHMDFSDDPTLGGALDLFYDETRLSFISFSFDPLFPSDPYFTSTGDASVDGVVSAVGFGNFIAGLSGPSLVGSFIFEAVATGNAALSMAENVLPLGGFYSFANSQDQTPVFSGANVSISAVPLPSAAWLLISGLVGVMGFTRRQRS